MEEAKNMALLFFMDHLMQKNGRRTIHDLSCQFGARGFSEEMRNAVGTTQEGLTEFLQQHPSLFTLEGDQVILNGFGDITAKNNPLLQSASRSRDYEKEAVEFFVMKLTKFGPELQIKSLLGHRSQAAPEVRLVSGRHLKEFCEFLQSQTEHFVVEGDRVRLKNMPEPDDNAIELDDEGKPLAGVKAKQAAVEYLKSVLEQNEDQPIPLDMFYQRFCQRFSHSIRQDVATNPKELLQFLKLNRGLFFIRSNKVTLVKNRPSEDGSENGSDEGDLESNNNSVFPLDQNALARIHFVKALKPAQELVERLLQDIHNQERKVVGLDFKTVTVGIDGELFLSLCVVATQSQIGVFDLASSDVIIMESGLRDILESDKITKVIHDARRVGSLLAHKYAVHMVNVFDTQVAHSVLQHEKFGKPLHDLRSISFVNLQRVYYPQSIMLSDVTPRKLSQSPNWGIRPMSDELLLSSVEEAHCLLSALHQTLSNLIPVHLRGLFEDKCIEVLLASPTRPPPLSFNPGSPYRISTRGGGRAQPVSYAQSGYGDRAAPPAHVPPNSSRRMADACTQTFSTGDIQVLNVFYE
ncbi:Egalitarian [Trichostrongylus colubriformis]|uniref:Egalitarian n=1 Tax=Trichostrongylus colubriformis TaxID=6319 RepID=A0AAN8G5E5_TRICO